MSHPAIEGGHPLAPRTARRYPISVVVPTASGWPAAGLALDSILPQLRAHGGELLVADVSGVPPPVELRDAPDTQWLEMPGKWIIRARRAAYDRAAGEIVALTEDHCTVAPDWIERILAAHARNGQVAAITGTVANGTTEHLADWALYLTAHARLAAPLPEHPALNCARPASSSSATTAFAWRTTSARRPAAWWPSSSTTAARSPACAPAR